VQPAEHALDMHNLALDMFSARAVVVDSRYIDAPAMPL
jgi:hypothetical protein